MVLPSAAKKVEEEADLVVVQEGPGSPWAALRRVVHEAGKIFECVCVCV